MGRDTKKLHPFVQMLGDALIKECHRQGMNVKITDCVRNKQEQDACIKAGTSRVRFPYSYHAWALAFDICQNDSKCPYPSDNEWWKRVGKIGKKLGLEWGGYWLGRDIDRPHFQLNSYTGGKNNVVSLIRIYGNPSTFFRHNDFQIITPTKPITPLSSKKKILWLQVKLNCQEGGGYGLELDGVYGAKTTRAVKDFWKKKTGKKCTGKLVKKSCIDLL